MLDLEGMTTDELRALRARVEAILAERDEREGDESMADDLAGRIFTGDVATRLATSGAAGTALVAGIQGESPLGASIQRVYLDPGLKSYVEFQADAAITNQELSTGLFDCTGFWLPPNQECTCWLPIATTASNLSAPKLARASGAAFRAAARNGAVPGTARFGILEAGAAAWGLAGTLGFQDDIISGAESVVDEIGSFFGSLF